MRPGTNGEDAPHDVLVDRNAEGQGNLLSDPGTTPGRIPLFHVNDRGDDVLSGSFWTWLRRHRGGEEPPILPLGQRSMKAQERCGFEDDCGTDQPARAHEERAHAGDQAIGATQIGEPLSRTVEDQQLLLTSTDSATTERAPPGPARRATVASRFRNRTARSRTAQS